VCKAQTSVRVKKYFTLTLCDMSILDRNVLRSQGKGIELPPLSFEHGSDAETLICDIIHHIIGACNEDLLHQDRMANLEENIVQAVREDYTLQKFPQAKKMLKEQERLLQEQRLLTEQLKLLELQQENDVSQNDQNAAISHKDAEAADDPAPAFNDDQGNINQHEDHAQQEEDHDMEHNSEEDASDADAREDPQAIAETLPVEEEAQAAKGKAASCTYIEEQHMDAASVHAQDTDVEKTIFLSDNVDVIHKNDDARSEKSFTSRRPDEDTTNRIETASTPDCDDNRSGQGDNENEHKDANDENQAVHNKHEQHVEYQGNDGNDIASSLASSDPLLHGTEFPIVPTLHKDPTTDGEHGTEIQKQMDTESFSHDVHIPDEHHQASTLKNTRAPQASRLVDETISEDFSYANNNSHRRVVFTQNDGTVAACAEEFKYAPCPPQQLPDEEQCDFERDEAFAEEAHIKSNRSSRRVSADSVELREASLLLKAPLFRDIQLPTTKSHHDDDMSEHEKSDDGVSKHSSRLPSRTSSRSGSPPREAVRSRNTYDHDTAKSTMNRRSLQVSSVPMCAIKPSLSINMNHGPSNSKTMGKDYEVAARRQHAVSSSKPVPMHPQPISAKISLHQGVSVSSFQRHSRLNDLDSDVLATVDAEDCLDSPPSQLTMNRAPKETQQRSMASSREPGGNHYPHHSASAPHYRNGAQAQYDPMQLPSVYHPASMQSEVNRPFNFDLERQKLNNKKLRQVRRDLRHPMDNAAPTPDASSSSTSATENHSRTEAKSGKGAKQKFGGTAASPTADDENATDVGDSNNAQMPKKPDDAETEEIKRLKFMQEIEDLIIDILGMREEMGEKFTEESREHARTTLKEKSRAALKLIRQSLKEKVVLSRRTDSYQDWLTMGCSMLKTAIERFKPLGQRAAELDAVLARRNPEIRQKLLAFAKDKKVPFLDELSEKAAPLRTVYSILAEADKETKAKEAQEEKSKEDQRAREDAPAQSSTCKSQSDTNNDVKKKKKKQKAAEEASATTLWVMQALERMNKSIETNQTIMMQLLSQQASHQHAAAQHAAVQHAAALHHATASQIQNSYGSASSIAHAATQQQSYAAESFSLLQGTAATNSSPASTEAAQTPAHPETFNWSGASSPCLYTKEEKQEVGVAVAAVPSTAPANPITLSQISLQVSKHVNHTQLPTASTASTVAISTLAAPATSVINAISGKSTNSGMIDQQLLVDIPAFVEGQQIEATVPKFMQLDNQSLSTIQETEEEQQKSPRADSCGSASLFNSPILVSPHSSSPVEKDSLVLLQSVSPADEVASPDDDMMEFLLENLEDDADSS
jgi:hypothetical protein